MHSRVNDVEVLLAEDDILVDHSRMNCSHIVVIHLTTDDLDLIPVSLELHLVDSNLVHLLDDTGIVWSQHLSAIAPVSLVAIVLLRVVRSSNVDTSLGTELADSE